MHAIIYSVQCRKLSAGPFAPVCYHALFSYIHMYIYIYIYIYDRSLMVGGRMPGGDEGAIPLPVPFHRIYKVAWGFFGLQRASGPISAQMFLYLTLQIFYSTGFDLLITAVSLCLLSFVDIYCYVLISEVYVAILPEGSTVYLYCSLSVSVLNQAPVDSFCA